MKSHIKYYLFTIIAATAFIHAEEQKESLSPKPMPTMQNFTIVNEDLIPRTLSETPNINAPFQAALVKTIVNVHVDGEIIQLSDGSSWDISYYFGRKEVRNYWKVGDQVVICYADRFFTPFAIHNISQDLSVYGLLRFPPKPSATDTVIITAIHSGATIETNKGTTISFGLTLPLFWEEFSVGDIIQLFPPVEGTLDGSVVKFCNYRMNLIYPILYQHTVTE